jgi:hypothetical protein
MSDVGRLKRPGGSPFPSVRKSADPFQPEMGEMDFSQEVAEFDALYSTAVQEPGKTEQTIISDENRKKQFRYRKRKRKKDDEENKSKESEENFIDLQA